MVCGAPLWCIARHPTKDGLLKDVVIFGGAGFIGQHLARRLIALGANRIVLADLRRPTGTFEDAVSFVECDVRRPIELEASADTVVFDLAAVHRTPGHEDHEYFETNVAGARNIADFCERSGVSRVFFTSSIAVYGPSEEATTERTPPQPAIAYGHSKLQAEQIYDAWAHGAPGRTLVVARPGTVFGPGEGGNFTRLAAALAKRRFVYPGRRDTIKACGYVADLIESLRFAEDLASPTVTYNFGLAAPPTIEQVCVAFCNVAGFARPRFVAPAPVLVAAAKTLTKLGATNIDPDRVMKLVQSTHIIPQVLIDSGYPYRFDLEGALADWYATEPAGRFV